MPAARRNNQIDVVPDEGSALLGRHLFLQGFLCFELAVFELAEHVGGDEFAHRLGLDKCVVHIERHAVVVVGGARLVLDGEGVGEGVISRVADVRALGGGEFDVHGVLW